MKIVFLVDWFLYYTVELVNAFAKEHEVMLITRDHSYEICGSVNHIFLDDFLDECLDKAALREKLMYKRRDPRGFFEIRRLYKKIKDFNPDILHVQENMDWRIFLLAKMFGFSKIVLTVHDVLSHPGEHRGLQGFFVKAMRKNAKGIIVHGEFLKRQLISKSGVLKEKTHVIPHGVYDIYKKWDDNRINEEENTVLFFGRISKYKGINILIKAQPLIAEEIKDIKIIIAGNGEDFTKYRRLMTNKNSFEIHNRFIPHEEIHKFFRRASVVALPYTEASQSGVAALAYAFGKPVVATNVGSIPEVIEDGKTGFIVPPNNPQLLADAIIKMLKDVNLRKLMSRNMLNKAEADLSWSHIAKLTVNVYLQQ